jgi:hypothetical protein
MPVEHLATVSDLVQWAARIEGRYDLPDLIRRLVLATSNPKFIEFRAQEGAGYAGWDGRVETDSESNFVPAGPSGWEMGAGEDPGAKATNDYRKRTGDPDPFNAAQTAFVFCTPRRWAGKKGWTDERRSEAVWREVRAYDADDLILWLSSAHGVHVWFSLKIGKPIEHVQDLFSWWSAWRSVTDPSVSPELILSGRSESITPFMSLLMGEPRSITIRAESSQEALAFVAAACSQQPQDTRDELGSRMLLVDRPEAWRFFAAQESRLILIPNFQNEALVIEAIKNGHHVIILRGRDFQMQVDIDVPRLSAVGATEVLEREGLSSVKARHMSALARRSFSAYRRVNAIVLDAMPEWTQGEHGPEIIPLILAGEWDEAVEGDRDFLERLTRQSYDEIEAELLRWRDQPDSAFRCIGSHWSVNAKEDSWRMVSRYASVDVLNRFVDLALQVLQERDPRRELEGGEQPYAALRGIRRRYSTKIRNGLADTLAMLGALGSPESEITIANGNNTFDFANRAVQSLMKTAVDHPQAWLDLAEHLRSLAEASPDTFCDYVERDIAAKNNTLLILFEPQPGLLSPNYAYPNLLWALEMLAWSSTHFPRVAFILARLAAIAPETRLSNSPLDSLVSFFRLWFPQSNSTPEVRLQILDRIRGDLPEIAWKLMVCLLPSSHDSAMISSGPGARAVLWRAWPSEGMRPTIADYWKSVATVSERLIEDVSVRPEYWLTLVEHLNDLHPDLREAAVKRLESLPESLEDEELKAKLWACLRDLVARHRTFGDADWAMPEPLLERLDAVREAISPKDPSIQYQWLFGQHPELEVNPEAYRQELERQRVAAVQEMMAEGGLDNVFALAQATQVPGEVGVALYSLGLDHDESKKTLDAIGLSNAHKQLVGGFVWKAVREEGEVWVQEFLNIAALGDWSDDMRATALHFLPVNASTLNMVDQQNERTRQIYWQEFNSFWIYEPDVIDRLVDGLIEFGRPRSAIHSLAMHVSYEKTPVDFMTVQRALLSSLTTPLEEDQTQMSSHDINRLLRFLRDHPNSDKEVLEQLEWSYLPAIRLEPSDLYLHDRLAKDPGFFVEVVGLAFKRDGQTESGLVDPENAKRARALLDTWRKVPGVQPDGTIADAYLKQWIDQATKLLEQSALRQGGLYTIGELLRWGPGESEGLWPDPAICNIIQDLASDTVDESFEMAIYNSRGVTSRGPFSGGDQERDLAEKYDNYAQHLYVNWPRVAAILRRLAATYRTEAIRHDREAERREDDLG